MFSGGYATRFPFVLALLLLIHTVVDSAREARSYCHVDQTHRIQQNPIAGFDESTTRFDGEWTRSGANQTELSISVDYRSSESFGVNRRSGKYVNLVSVIVRANLVSRPVAVRLELPEPSYHPDDEVVLAADFDFLRTPTHETRGKPWTGRI